MLRNKGTRWSLHTLGSAIRHAEITIIIIWFSPVSGAHKRKIGHRHVVAVLAGLLQDVEHRLSVFGADSIFVTEFAAVWIARPS
ncbi:MAG: hypothetical protein V3S78_04040, partial [Hyphomicrobium sp.]